MAGPEPICSGPSYALLLTQGLVLAGSTGEGWLGIRLPTKDNL